VQGRPAANKHDTSVLQHTKKESIDMDSSEIDTYLQALGEELADRAIRKPVRLAVVGGVYMLFFLKNRLATKDVDVVAAFIPPLGPLTPTRRSCRATPPPRKKSRIGEDAPTPEIARIVCL